MNGPVAPMHVERNSSPVEEDVSIAALVTAVMQNLGLLWKCALAAALIALALTAIKGVTYVAESKFAPQIRDDRSSRLGGLASQFGVALPSSGSSESLQFYVELIKSREILRRAVLTPYEVNDPSGGKKLTGNLTTFFRSDGETAEQRTRAAVGKLGRDVAVTTNLDANVIAMRVTTDYPALSVAVNQRLLKLLDERSREIKRQRAVAERGFASERLQEVAAELRAAEGELERYLTGNRSYQTSARQNLEVSRIQRKVDLNQQLYASMAQAHEQARLEEVRSTPIIGLIDSPEGSVRRNGGRYVRNAILGVIVGTFIGMLMAIWTEYLKRFRQAHPDRYSELRSAFGRRRSK